LLAIASTDAFAADELPHQVVDVLNYALSLEYFESTFYKTANGTEGLIPTEYQRLFREIGPHESGHVALISGVLGSAAVKAQRFDFTAGGKYADVFSSSPRLTEPAVAARKALRLGLALASSPRSSFVIGASYSLIERYSGDQDQERSTETPTLEYWPSGTANFRRKMQPTFRR
jgi:hypothetical protein